METIFPEIQVCRLVTTAGQTWTLYVYKEFGHIPERVWGELEEMAEAHFSNFVRQMHLEGIPFLVGFFFEKQEIRLYSSRLSWELLLMEMIEEKEIPSAWMAHVKSATKLRFELFPSEYDLSTHQYRLADLVGGAYGEIDEEVKSTNGDLLEKMDGYRPGLFERCSDLALHLTAKYDVLRIHLLKFVAILPALEHDRKGGEVARMLQEHLRRLLQDNRRLRDKGLRSFAWFLELCFLLVYGVAKVCPHGILARGVRYMVHFAARRFIAGENIQSAEVALRALEESGRNATLDPWGNW